MTGDPFKSADPRTPRRRVQFSMAAMLFSIVLVGILLGTWSGIMGRGNAAVPRGVYLLIAIVSPMAIMIALSLYYSARRGHDHANESHPEDE